jgi:hypothetical protein
MSHRAFLAVSLKPPQGQTANPARSASGPTKNFTESSVYLISVIHCAIYTNFTKLTWRPLTSVLAWPPLVWMLGTHGLTATSDVTTMDALLDIKKVLFCVCQLLHFSVSTFLSHFSLPIDLAS